MFMQCNENKKAKNWKPIKKKTEKQSYHLCFSSKTPFNKLNKEKTLLLGV